MTMRVYLVKRQRTLRTGTRRAYWYLQWSGTSGKPQFESLGRCDKMTKKEAQQMLDTKSADIFGRKIARDKPKRMTLRAFLDEDLAAMEGEVRASTMMEYRNAYRHVRAALGDDADVSRLTHADVGRVKSHLTNPPATAEHDRGLPDQQRRRPRPKRTRPPSPATVSKILRAVRGAFNRGVEHGVLHHNPFGKLKQAECAPKSKRIFTRVEVDLLATIGPDLWRQDVQRRAEERRKGKAKATGKKRRQRTVTRDVLWWQTFIRLAVTTGLRKNELLNLTWRDIDFDASTVTVQAKIADVVTINRRTLRTWNWSAKARSSYRTVPIADDGETIAMLRRLRMKHGRSPFVFVTLDRLSAIQRHIQPLGHLPPKYDIAPLMLREFKAIQHHAAKALAERQGAKQVDWPFGCLHDLRKTYGTEMASAVPMHVLREWMGHSDIATTAKFYLGLGDGMAERARAVYAREAAG